MSLERWSVPIAHQSIARLLLKHYVEELSNMFWCGHSSVDTVNYSSIDLSGTDLAIDIITLEDKDQRQRILDYQFDKFREFSEQFKTWTNHNAVIALSSVFEMYLKRIFSIAIQSDPGIFAFSSKAIDGTKLLKKKESYNYDAEVKKFTKGEWEHRLSAFRQLFSFELAELENIKSDLDKFRNARNKVGHIYARNTEIDDDFSEYHTLEPLNYNNVINWMSLVKNAADIIDNYLFKEHIGMYELIWYYHTWSIKGIIQTSTDFKLHLISLGYYISDTLCCDVRDYYKNLD